MRFRCSKLNAWNTFCWKKRQENQQSGATGKDVLQELVKDYRTEYQELADDKKAKLLLEYSRHKEMKALGIQISTKSKITDVTHTLKAVENELNNLRSHTRTEAMLYAMRRSTDLPLHGVSFATEGVDDFTSSVMNLDSQDLVSKMEGFAVQGMKVIIEGWPTNIPFTNLSQVSSTLPYLEMLLWKWRSTAIKWRQLDDEEFQELLKERNEKLENGEAWPSDGSGELNQCKKTYKSIETVDTDDEEADSTEDTPVTNINANTETSTNANINTDTSVNSNAKPSTFPSITNPGAFHDVDNGASNFDPTAFNFNPSALNFDPTTFNFDLTAFNFGLALGPQQF
ncbi:uncharacterized protein F5147DRAFT_771432 [Suillus discolor]|uniref:Uncharacterized protein n=1 Tax=Suillus discolor TaxID=1912936 RepID=A0A9P7JW00_9AGAM|nr:uncharacterized protein F5147DRAFT_771432 [Suillus discolor]KAG2112367.1 hypothetical protein F5147DRAFT_771432 [Suillus discolor]